MNREAKAAIGLMIVTIISKVLGFGREIVMGAAYGTSTYTDAYVIAMNIPITIFGAVGAALATTFIPLYYENVTDGGQIKANKYTNNIVNIIFILTLVLAVICLIFIEPIVKVFALGFTDETLKIAVDFTKILIFGIVFIALSNIITAILQVKNNFIIPGLIGIPYNIIIIITIIISSKLDANILAIGTLLAMASQVVFQIPFALKKGWKYKFDIEDRKSVV